MATIYGNTNTAGVITTPAGPTVATLFGISQPTYLTRVYLYFFAGADPNMQILLRQVPDLPPAGIPGPDMSFGPFAVVLSAGQGGVANVNVEAFPNIVVPAGKYQVVPLLPMGVPNNWSFNAQSGLQGFTEIDGNPVVEPGTPPTNQYALANWSVSQARPQRVLWLQAVGVSATYLAIYRITNSEWSTLVNVTTPDGSFTLQPGASVDISAQRIDIEATGLPAWGTFGDICCGPAVVQTPAPKPAPAPEPKPAPAPEPKPAPPANDLG